MRSTATAAAIAATAAAFIILSKYINTSKWTGLNKIFKFDIAAERKKHSEKKSTVESKNGYIFVFVCLNKLRRIDEILVHNFLTAFEYYGNSFKRQAKKKFE